MYAYISARLYKPWLICVLWYYCTALLRPSAKALQVQKLAAPVQKLSSAKISAARQCKNKCKNFNLPGAVF
jgi:hypothetical protein